MTTLIVGCGYLGCRVGRLLSERGERVVGSTRSEAKADALRAWGIEPVVADVLDPESLAVLPAADRVLYGVGFDRSAGIPMRTVYVQGLRHALERLAGQTKRVVYASSTGVYGQSGGVWVDETSPTEPKHATGRVVLDAETTLHELAAVEGFEAVIVRFSGLYGPGRVVRRALVETGAPIPADPEGYLNLIHIDDAAALAVEALDRGESGAVYLASDDRPVTRRDYYERLATLLNAPAPRFEPPRPGSPEARRQQASKRVSNRKIKYEFDYRFLYPDITTGLPAALTGSG